MYISQELRQRVYNKYGGRCAYSGTPLQDNWQVDHFYPVRYCNSTLPTVQPVVQSKKLTDPNAFHNLMPAQRIVNHYKRALLPEKFKTWYLGGLHVRLAKLPKNPQVPKTVRHKEYLLEVAALFDITPDRPFDQIFYFETLQYHRTK